jgi:8-oxo-dGTP pyrophosphatase MutT (NUDIX family)
MSETKLHRPNRRPGAKAAYGGVLINEDSLVLLREPKGHFGGYVWTFAKGGADVGESPEEAALREVREETGFEAEIVGELTGWFVGTTSDTKFFLMRPIRDHGDFHDETAAVRWASFDEAVELIGKTETATGRARDLEILAAAQAAYREGAT